MKIFSSINDQFVKIGLTKKNMLHYRWSILLFTFLLSVFVFSLSQHINLFFSLLNILFIFFVLILVAKIKIKLLRVFFHSLVVVLLSLNLTFSIAFSVPLSLGNLASILETNFSEIIAFDWRIYLLGGLCLLVTTILSQKSIYELKSKFSGGRVGVSLLALVVFVNIFAVSIPVWRNYDFFKGYRKDLQEMPVQSIYAFSSLRLPLLYGDVFGLAVYSIEKMDSHRFKNREKNLPEGVFFSEEKKSISKIYLVIGESAWREKMSLYGNSIPTTPFLNSLKRIDSSAISYYKAISIANMTRDAVRFSLSFANPRNRDAFWSEKNVVEMAKSAGYGTSWLSNQGQAGIYDNYPSYIARSSDQVYFEKSLVKDDLDLLTELERSVNNEEKQFVALHLMGSHFPYSDRYDEVDRAYLSTFPLATAYEMSIHHTDQLLKRLYDYTINMDTNSIIVYYSDHGASPERGIHGLKGFHASEYEIPLLIFKNNVEVDIDSIISQYLSVNDDQYVNSSNLIYILSEIMGYDISSEVKSSAVSRSNEIMLVDGSLVDYESLKDEK